jgi:CDP-diacylglycerol--glycerol-3-phosphate 3-phosphatidyltransferase
VSAAEVLTQRTGALPAFRWNLPNILTLGRVGSIPVLVVLLTLAPSVPGQDQGLWYTLALLLTVGAGITDTLDGYLARKYQEVTRFGKFSDPVADKLLTTAVFVLLAERGQVPGWMVVVILSREFAVMALRMILAMDRVMVPSSRWAKVKTIFQVVAMVGILLVLALAELGGGGWVVLPASVVVYFGRLSVIALWIALGLTVGTGVEYFRATWAALDESEEDE